MSRSLLWTTVSVVAFTFAAMMIFFWVREGSLENAGASMDRTLSRAGDSVVTTTEEVIDATGDAITDATDGDEAT